MPYKNPTPEQHEAMKKYRRDWYYRNKERAKASIKTRKKSIADWYADFKSTLKCNRCPESHPAVLDFHHLDPNQKDFNLSQAVTNGYSSKRILEEIEKCEILCSNCHRKHHHNERMAQEQGIEP